MNKSVPFRLLDICNQQLVSGVKPVPDSAFSASSSYHKGSNAKDYTVARARINTTETKDSKGVLHLGAWSAQNLNVDQWIQVRPFGVSTPKNSVSKWTILSSLLDKLFFNIVFTWRMKRFVFLHIFNIDDIPVTTVNGILLISFMLRSLLSWKQQMYYVYDFYFAFNVYVGESIWAKSYSRHNDPRTKWLLPSVGEEVPSSIQYGLQQQFQQLAPYRRPHRQWYSQYITRLTSVLSLVLRFILC